MTELRFSRTVGCANVQRATWDRRASDQFVKIIRAITVALVLNSPEVAISACVRSENMDIIANTVSIAKEN